MMTFLVWPITLLGLISMAGWARWLLHRAEGRALLRHNPLLLVLTTLGLSAGAISLAMLALGLLRVRIDWRVAAAVCAVIGGIGLLMRDRPFLRRDADDAPIPAVTLRNVERTALIIIVILCGLILFNAVYWPFGIDDAITIYAYYGRTIASSGQLPVGPLYETYPMLVPLNYAFVFQASGWVNEYLAALIPGLLSVGVIGVAYLLGRELINHAAGVIAALLTALAPMIAHWASSGYTDLPAGFYYGMAALFLARLTRTRRWPDALLAGIMAGLAAWTKNSALLLAPIMALWVVYRWWLSRRTPYQEPYKLAHLALMALGFALTAGPWYMRNLITAGVLMPPTGWTWKADRSLSNLFPYLIDPRYGLIGLIFTAGVGFVLWLWWRTRGREAAPAFLATLALPFYAVWWLLFSYDGRFLLLLTPLIAVMAAGAVLALWQRLPTIPRMMWLPYLIPIMAIMALAPVIAAVDYKFDLIRRPFMSDAEKHRLRIGERYDFAQYLKTLPAGSKVWTEDQLLPFYADGISMTVGLYPTDAQQLAGHDYWALAPGETLPEWFAKKTPLHTQGGYRLYAVR